jgi:hypothetical protein
MKAVMVTATNIHIHNKSYRNMTRDYNSENCIPLKADTILLKNKRIFKCELIVN